MVPGSVPWPACEMNIESWESKSQKAEFPSPPSILSLANFDEYLTNSHEFNDVIGVVSAGHYHLEFTDH